VLPPLSAADTDQDFQADDPRSFGLHVDYFHPPVTDVLWALMMKEGAEALRKSAENLYRWGEWSEEEYQWVLARLDK
jgi:hypothetical protein